MQYKSSRHRRRTDLYLLRLLTVSTVLATTSAFVTIQPSLNYPNKSKLRNGTTKILAFSGFIPCSSILPMFRTKEDEDDENVDDDENNSGVGLWLGWLSGGKRLRGTNKVIMREAEELGGVPRSDRYSSRDWFHNTITLLNSAILRDIMSPVLVVTSWGTFLAILHEKLLRKSAETASHMYFPAAPHSLTMSALGLLLVFRTNSAYQRFAEGRKIWELIINNARDLYRMSMLYENEIGIDKRRRIQRLLAAFPYLLRHRIRPNLVMRRLDDEEYERDPENTILLYQDNGPRDTDPEAAIVAKNEEELGQSRRKTRPLYWVDKRTLPWRLLPGDALEYCAKAQNRPLWVCDRIARELRDVPDGPNFSARERLALIAITNKLSACIGGAERIHQTVVPLNYARHTLRALTIWLFSFPFAVVKDLRLFTGPVLFVMSWLLFGVYEIGYAIEDPFQGSLRLSILCDTIRRDVLADERLRATAFDLEERIEELDELVEREGEIVDDIETMTNQTDINETDVNGEDLKEIMEAIETITTGATSDNSTQPYQ